jgi:hypothetical protein
VSKERELLESCLDEFQYQSFPCTELVTRIKELLAQPEQEPVAWCWEEQFGVIMGDWGLVSSIHKPKESKYRKNIHPLYMSPQKVEQEPSDTEIITAYQMLVRRKLGLQEKNEVLQLGEPKFKVCENKIDGSCPLHNLQCNYPECEE